MFPTMNHDVGYLYKSSLELIQSPVIKRFESGAYLITLLIEKASHLIFPESQNPQLEFLSDLKGKLGEQFKQFKEHLSDQDMRVLSKFLVRCGVCVWQLDPRVHHDVLGGDAENRPDQGGRLDLDVLGRAVGADEGDHRFRDLAEF